MVTRPIALALIALAAGVSTAEPRAGWRPILNGVDREDIEDAFGPLFALPTTFRISRDGRVCARHVGLPTPKDVKDPSVSDVKKAFEAQIKGLL
jgi:hypothetical protein